jgi:hypothetical protein
MKMSAAPLDKKIKDYKQKNPSAPLPSQKRGTKTSSHVIVLGQGKVAHSLFFYCHHHARFFLLPLTFMRTFEAAENPKKEYGKQTSHLGCPRKFVTDAINHRPATQTTRAAFLLLVRPQLDNDSNSISNIVSIGYPSLSKWSSRATPLMSFTNPFTETSSPLTPPPRVREFLSFFFFFCTKIARAVLESCRSTTYCDTKLRAWGNPNNETKIVAGGLSLSQTPRRSKWSLATCEGG